MRINQMITMQTQHGGLINNPTLNGLDALRVLGYWWRSRGRFWQGWVTALRKLRDSGIPASISSASKVFTPAQSRIVWDAAAEAADDLKRLAPKATPRAFTESQATADAKTIAQRFIAKDFKSKIPALLPSTPKAAEKANKAKPPKKETNRIVPPIEIPDDLPTPPLPTIPRPRLRLGKLGWIIVAALVANAIGDD